MSDSFTGQQINVSTIRLTAAEWTAQAYVLPLGVIGEEIDTGKAKIGDGETAWTSLGYWNPSGSTGGVTDDFALEFTAANQGHVNHGAFLNLGVDYQKFLIEFYIKPTGGEYFFSPGYGGNHAPALIGVGGDTDGFTIHGNTFDANTSTTTEFSTPDVIRYDRWAVVSVGYDGSFLTVHINGVPSTIVATTGKIRINNFTENTLYVGGSDHQNFTGRIAGWRVFLDKLGYVAGATALRNTVYRPDIRYLTQPTVATSTDTTPVLAAPYFKGTLDDFGTGLNKGTKQIITQTVVAASGITGNGNARCIVTARDMPNSPKTVTFAVTTASQTTATLIATAARTALLADADVKAFFMVGGTTADFTLTAIDPAVNDSTMNVTIENVTCTGITDDTTSTISTVGVLGKTVRHNGSLQEASAGFGSMLTDRDSTKRPTWVTDAFEWPTDAAAQKTQIVGSYIYDDFSRADVHYGNSSVLGCGITRVGAKTWSSNVYGILNGCMFAGADSTTASNILTDDGNVNKSISWSRPNATWSGLTGVAAVYALVFRYTDANNYEYIYLDEYGSGYVFEVVAGVGTNIASFTMGGTWTTAKVTVSGTSCTVYADGVSKATPTLTANLTGTGVGVRLNSCLLRISEIGVV